MNDRICQIKEMLVNHRMLIRAEQAISAAVLNLAMSRMLATRIYKEEIRIVKAAVLIAAMKSLFRINLYNRIKTTENTIALIPHPIDAGSFFGDL